MRFQANVVENLKSAKKANDVVLFKDILIDEISQIIENKPSQMISLLKKSNVKIGENTSKQNLIDVTSYNLYNNLLFQKNLALSIERNFSMPNKEFLNQEGGGESGGGESGGGKGNIVSSIADMIGSISKWGSASTELKAEEERTKSKLYDKIFNRQEKKRNWLPVVVIAGVLLIGTLVVYNVTKK